MQRNYWGRLWLVLVPAIGLCLPPAAGGDQTGSSFDSWLKELRHEARSNGISVATLDAALSGVTPLRLVLDSQRRQPEQRLRLESYLERVVPQERVRAGEDRSRASHQLLQDIGVRYGVQPRFLVALWGVESDYGRNQGTVPTVASLATLAYGGRRQAYFRRELLEALTILDRHELEVPRMVGSWAGAMGQCQFMPSNFLRIAVDYDGDGRRDIWSTEADVLASIANFLSRLGWKDDQTWGREVLLPSDFDARLVAPDVRLKLGRWQILGVRRADGRNLPTRDLSATIITPDGPRGRAFVVYGNFECLLRWNRSTHFALAVGHLANRLRQQ